MHSRSEELVKQVYIFEIDHFSLVHMKYINCHFYCVVAGLTLHVKCSHVEKNKLSTQALC